MRIFNLMSILLYTLILVPIGCSEEPPVCPGSNPEPDYITIIPTIDNVEKASTRMAGTAFQEGDEIGLYAVERADGASPAGIKSSGNYGHNKRYVFRSGVFNPFSESDKIYPSGKKLDYYAYYPYRVGHEPTAWNMTVSTDQRTLASFSKGDFLSGSNRSGLSSPKQSVSMRFHRQSVYIRFIFKPSPYFTVGQAELRGAYPSARLNIQTEQGMSVGDSARIMMRDEGSDKDGSRVWGALVPWEFTYSSVKPAGAFHLQGGGMKYFRPTKTLVESKGKRSQMTFTFVDPVSWEYLLTVTPRDVVIGSKATESMLTVTSKRTKLIGGKVVGAPEDCAYAITSKAPWVTVQGNKLIIAANTTHVEREGIVIISQTGGKKTEVIITQEGKLKIDTEN